MNPGEAIFHPGVIAGRHDCGLVEAANGDIDFVGIRFRNKHELCAALRTKRTQTRRPFYLTRLSGRETKAASTERCPGDERSATAAAAIQAMAVCDVVRLPGRLVAH